VKVLKELLKQTEVKLPLARLTRLRAGEMFCCQTVGARRNPSRTDTAALGGPYSFAPEMFQYLSASQSSQLACNSLQILRAYLAHIENFIVNFRAYLGTSGRILRTDEEFR
jgi:hypothetical protein